jgi:hypothetical protein
MTISIGQDSEPIAIVVKATSGRVKEIPVLNGLTIKEGSFDELAGELKEALSELECKPVDTSRIILKRCKKGSREFVEVAVDVIGTPEQVAEQAKEIVIKMGRPSD